MEGRHISPQAKDGDIYMANDSETAYWIDRLDIYKRNVSAEYNKYIIRMEYYLPSRAKKYDI